MRLTLTAHILKISVTPMNFEARYEQKMTSKAAI